MASFLDFLSPGPSSGGLLDFLRNNALNQTFPSGLPSDQAQYGSVPVTSYSSPSNASSQMPAAAPQQPMPAQQGAQPIPQQPVQQSNVSLPAGPSIGDRLLNSVNSFANSGGLIPAFANGLTSLVTGQRADPEGVKLQQQAQIGNLTARALIAKGIDPQTALAAVQPGNGDMLKTLITQAYGPQTIENLGSGYIRDPRTGKITRAYTPDDKIPQGFTQDDKGNLHFTPGGPADPEYIRQKAITEQTALAEAKRQAGGVSVLGKGAELYSLDPKTGQPIILHKNEDGAEASLSDDTVKTMATQYLAGDKSVLTNLGRGAQGAANIVKLREEIAKQANAHGLDGNGIAQRMIDYVGDTARERTAATQEGRMAPAGFEAAGAIDLARKASAAVPRGNWVPINRAIQYYEKNSGDPAIRAFGSANTTLINTYARAINPNGVGTVADKEHAREMLSTADSPAAYEAVLQQLEKEIQMAHNSPSQARKAFAADRASRLGNTGPASFEDRFANPDRFGATSDQPATTGKTKNGVSWGVVQ